MKNIIVSILLTLLFSPIHGQVNPSTGGTINGSNGQLTYSVGGSAKPSHYSIQGSIGSILFQFQPDSQTVLNSDDFKVEIYPNPTNSQITININRSRKDRIYYQLYDFEGKVLLEETILEDEEPILLDSFDPGVFVLKINVNKLSKSYKIIKR